MKHAPRSLLPRERVQHCLVYITEMIRSTQPEWAMRHLPVVLPYLADFCTDYSCSGSGG